jgi:hypothetical protein
VPPAPRRGVILTRTSMWRRAWDPEVNAIAVIAVGVALLATEVWVPGGIVLALGLLWIWLVVRRRRGA